MEIRCDDSTVKVCADQSYHVTVLYQRTVASVEQGCKNITEKIEKTMDRSDLFKLDLRLQKVNIYDEHFSEPDEVFQSLSPNAELSAEEPTEETTWKHSTSLGTVWIYPDDDQLDIYVLRNDLYYLIAISVGFDLFFLGIFYLCFASISKQ